MRTTLLIFFISVSTVFYCQTTTIDLYYGYHFCSDNYYNQLNSVDKFNPSKPFSTIGMAGTERLPKRKYQKVKFSFFIPSKIIIQDSLSFRSTGFVFDYDFSFDLIKNSPDKSKKKPFYFLVGLGFTTGQIYLGSNSLYNQKNPYFSPKLTIQPRYRVKKIIFSLTFDYSYDVSKGKWKDTRINKKNVATIKDFKQSGLTALFSIGYCYN